MPTQGKITIVVLRKGAIGTELAMLKYPVSQSMLFHVDISAATSRSLQKITQLNLLWVQHLIQVLLRR